MRRGCVLALVISLAAAPAARADEAFLYRPMLADLDESQVRSGVFSVTQDIR